MAKTKRVYFFDGVVSLDKNPEDSCFGTRATVAQILENLGKLLVSPGDILEGKDGFVFLDENKQPFEPEEEGEEEDSVLSQLVSFDY